MVNPFFARIHDHLLAKRQALTTWLRITPPDKRQLRLGPLDEQAFHEHLRVLDGALARSADHELGRCVVCHDYVDAALLEMDYTACVCLSHLSADERRDLEAELELAQRVQLALLPQVAPAISGDHGGRFQPPGADRRRRLFCVSVVSHRPAGPGDRRCGRPWRGREYADGQFPHGA